MAKKAEYKEMDLNGLKSALTDLEAELFDLKFQAALAKLENVSLIKHRRRDIARLKTYMKQQQAKKVEA